MLKCAECGHVFDDDDLAIWFEDRGEFWGMPCSEKMTGCPVCFSTAIDDFTGDDEEIDEGEEK